MIKDRFVHPLISNTIITRVTKENITNMTRTGSCIFESFQTHGEEWKSYTETVDSCHFVHDNEQFMNELGADLVVYPKQAMSHKKFRCVNMCKEGEGRECMLLPYAHVNDLEKHLIQCDYDSEQYADYQPKNQRTYSYSTIKTKSAKRRKCNKEEEHEEQEHKKKTKKKWGNYWIV